MALGTLLVREAGDPRHVVPNRHQPGAPVGPPAAADGRIGEREALPRDMEGGCSNRFRGTSLESAKGT